MNKETLHQITTRIDQLLTQQETAVIAVCGGSCTRKSTLVSQSIKDHYGDEATIIGQDRFQQQNSYIDNVNPKYMWDHPHNFGIEACVDAIEKLKKGESVIAPNYSFQKGVEITNEYIQPNKVIVIEGLYANYQSLAKANDLSIYVKSKWYARMIRRVFRNTLDRYKGRTEASILDGFCTSVTSAHIDFVKSQETYSDYVVETPLNFNSIIEYYNLEGISPKFLDQEGQIVVNENDLSIVLKSKGSISLQFLYRGSVYADFTIDQKLALLIQKTDFLRF